MRRLMSSLGRAPNSRGGVWLRINIAEEGRAEEKKTGSSGPESFEKDKAQAQTSPLNGRFLCQRATKLYLNQHVC